MFNRQKKAEALERQPPDMTEVDPEGLRQRVIQALRTVCDPVIPVNIYDLGLVYELNVDDKGIVSIRMTLTSPGCPVAQTFPEQVEQVIQAVSGVADVQVELVWEPPWSREMISEATRLELGL